MTSGILKLRLPKSVLRKIEAQAKREMTTKSTIARRWILYGMKHCLA